MHKTNDLNDGYMGSGKLIKAAINKHGRENFSKVILEILETEQEMREAEKRLVILGPDSYNLCEGGMGGFGFINSTPELILKRDNPENKIKGYLAAGERFRPKTGNLEKAERTAATLRVKYETEPFCWTGRKHKPETIEKMKIKAKARGNNNRAGRKHSPETIEKIRQSLLNRAQ